MSVINNSSVVVENSTFQENIEKMDGSNLLIDSSSMKIINTLFENNSAVQGTIYVRNDGGITIDNCTFEHTTKIGRFFSMQIHLHIFRRVDFIITIPQCLVAV